jgi:hypothetical protein
MQSDPFQSVDEYFKKIDDHFRSIDARFDHLVQAIAANAKIILDAITAKSGRA